MQADSRAKVNPLVVSGVALVLVIVAVVVWVLRDDPQPELSEMATPAIGETQIQLPPLPETRVDLAAEFQLQGELPQLNESDAVVESHLRLLAGAQPLEWLAGEQLLRRISIQVSSLVARDEFSYQQTPLKQPDSIAVRPLSSDRWLLDPTGYRRYDPYVGLLMNIEPELLVAFYRYYEPLLDQAYAELGNPIGAFRRDLIAAIEKILAAPVIEGDIQLVMPEANYEFADPALEALPLAQKQMIRMGPENTRRVQIVLGDFLGRIR